MLLFLMYVTESELRVNIREVKSDIRLLGKELGTEIRECYAKYEDIIEKMELLHLEIRELKGLIDVIK